MYRIGLKLWSTNTGAYLEQARRLYQEGTFDYIELYIVPNSFGTLSKWEKFDIPFTIHAPHFGHGFNLAVDRKKKYNYDIYKQTKHFADKLNADYIIFHGGNRGRIEETVSQLTEFDEPRALIENLPYHTLKDYKRLIGATLDEIRLIQMSTGCGFCLDFGHALCSANSQGYEPYTFMRSLLQLKPAMFHMSGVQDLTSTIDTHLSLRKGKLDPQIIGKLLPSEAKVSIETEKIYEDSLSDFVEDAKWLQSL